MPTLARFVSILILIAAVVAGAVFYLGNFIEPWDREITVRIPPSKLEPRPVAPPPAPVVAAPPVDGAGEAPEAGPAPQ
jgi:hypothetical protein